MVECYPSTTSPSCRRFPCHFSGLIEAFPDIQGKLQHLRVERERVEQQIRQRDEKIQRLLSAHPELRPHLSRVHECNFILSCVVPAVADKVHPEVLKCPSGTVSDFLPSKESRLPKFPLFEAERVPETGETFVEVGAREVGGADLRGVPRVPAQIRHRFPSYLQVFSPAPGFHPLSTSTDSVQNCLPHGWHNRFPHSPHFAKIGPVFATHYQKVFATLSKQQLYSAIPPRQMFAPG